MAAMLAGVLVAGCAPQQPKSAYHDQDPLGNVIEDEMNRDISKNNNPVGQAIDAEASRNPAPSK